MQRIAEYPCRTSHRRDSGSSFSLPSPAFTSYSDGCSDSASETCSSTSPSSFCTSAASSVASSPRLTPYKFRDELWQSDEGRPSPTQLTAYAASIIRNEAYALLALASRLSPVAQPVVVEEPPFPVDNLDGAIGTSEAIVEPETRTNSAFRAVVDALLGLPAHGRVIVTGVGKSGIVAQKMVATFNSLGVPSIFLHPLEALHGDLGVVCPCSPHSPCDALLLISHSGATAELMRLLPIIRPRVRALIAVTRDPDSVLARACTGWLDAGTGAYAGLAKDGEKMTDEADTDLPAPTSSVVSALAIGDALALSLSKLRLGWDKNGKARRQDFFRCHPGGILGITLGREGRGVADSSTFNASSPPPL